MVFRQILCCKTVDCGDITSCSNMFFMPMPLTNQWSEFFNEILAKNLVIPCYSHLKNAFRLTIYRWCAWFMVVLMGSSWESAASTSSSGMSVQSSWNGYRMHHRDPHIESCWLLNTQKKQLGGGVKYIYIYIIAQLASAHTLWQDIHNIWH